MRKSLLSLLASLGSVLLLVGAPAYAADAPPADVKGLWLIADYPIMAARPGEEAHFNLSLINYGLAPQLADLTLDNVPDGWNAELRGAGRPISAAFVDYNGKSHIELKVKVPADAKPQRYNFAVKATAAARTQDLALAVNVEPQSGAALTAEPKLPTLRGTPRSAFDFRINVKNDSADNMLVTLAAQAPRGFQVVFKEGYGSQELTSLPFKAGESKELAVDVKPPATLAAGRYPIKVQLSSERAKVETQLLMDVTGQPTVSLTGENDRLSGDANAGKEKRFVFVLRNTGSAEARNITLSASPPSGWKVSFDPKELPVLAPNAEEKVTATVTPSDKALAGDYMMSVRANGDAVSELANFRVTVLTSTVWGVVGLGVIAASLLVLLGGGRQVWQAMSAPVITAQRLTKRYGPTVAVDGLDLAIEKGDVFGLLGPNGAGKTTTILMILGLTEPTSGSITTLGYDPLREPLQVKRRVGYLPDTVGFYDHMTGRDNLRFTARLGGLPRGEIERSIGRALERVHLGEAADHPVKTYSRGMRQRLGIAEILMRKVEVAIFDEPTSGLDPQTTREFLALIRSLQGEGMTVVLSSHLLDLVQTMCDRVALFSDGRIGLSGRVDDLMRDVLGGTHVVDVEAGGDRIADRLAGIAGVTRVTQVADGRYRIDATADVRGNIANAIVNAGGELRSLSIARASLEDVYTRYFQTVRTAA